MDPLNLILLIIVVIIGWRLRSVLGTRNDNEKPGGRADAYRLNRDAYENPPQMTAAPRDAKGKEEAINAPEAPMDSESDSKVDDRAQQMGRGLAYLREIDPGFDEAVFLDGAARAYEMILMAFANDDLTPVQDFLDDEVAAGFEGAIQARQAAGQKLETRILRLDRPALDDAELTAKNCASMCACALRSYRPTIRRIRHWTKIICRHRPPASIFGHLKGRITAPSGN